MRLFWSFRRNWQFDIQKKRNWLEENKKKVCIGRLVGLMLHAYLFKGERKNVVTYNIFILLFCIFMLLTLQGLDLSTMAFSISLRNWCLLALLCLSTAICKSGLYQSKFCVYLVPIKILAPYEYQNQCWYVRQSVLNIFILLR